MAAKASRRAPRPQHQMRTLYEIGPLKLDPEAQVLTDAGTPLALGARAVAVLTALVSRANEYVQKSAIMDVAWPGLVVEEANLSVQMSAIRRVLARVPGGESWIETLARRGYRFVGPVIKISGSPSPNATVGRERTNLPQMLQSFVGRERELAEIKRLLPGTRLLTLTGTGGIGKTRLTLQAAAEAGDAYRDGVWFIDLAPLVDPALVPSALAQVLGVKESAGQSLVKSLSDHLRAQEVLVVLDNCEHVLDACARLAETLLRESAGVTLVATSREPLRIGPERTYPLGTLPLPDPQGDAQSIAQSDSVQLFVDRARQHRPGFDLQDQRARAVAEICVRLDGIPLALELAAARMAVLPVEQIVRLLDQRFRLLAGGSRSDLPRHQTLRALLDWSYELLDEAERQFFARLSVFAGGWTLAAAEVVGAGETIAKDDVVYRLIALVEKSLVVADEDGDRYRMLETVREYARDKLAASGNTEAVRERHRDYYLALAEEAEPKLTGPEQGTWLQRLEREHDNLRAALQWSVAAVPAQGALRLCGALVRFWAARGYLSEGGEWCRSILSRPAAAEPTKERADALQTAGALAHLQGDYPTARSRHDESLAIRRQLGDRKGIAASLVNLGKLALRQGDVGSARTLMEEGLERGKELGDRQLIAMLLVNLGHVAVHQGELAPAQAIFEESLAMFREFGDRNGIASTLVNLGVLAFELGDFSAARTLYEEGLAIVRELGDMRVIPIVLTNLGEVAFLQGDFLSAAALLQEGLTMRREAGDRLGIASSLEMAAAVVAALGNQLRSARIWGAAERLREEIGSPLRENARISYGQRVAAARAVLADDAAFHRAWLEGRASTLDEAIKMAQEPTVQQQ